MEDFTTPASNSTNTSTNAIDTSGLTKADTSKGFNANVGKQNTELKSASKPISTQTDSIKTPNTSQMSAEGLKGAKAPESGMSMPEGNGETTGFSAALSKKTQSYMSEKMMSSTSQTPSGDMPTPSESQSAIKPSVTDSPKSPQRPDAKIAKPNMDIGDTPNISAPALKATPSIQIPKFTLPNFKR